MAITFCRGQNVHVFKKKGPFWILKGAYRGQFWMLYCAKHVPKKFLFRSKIGCVNRLKFLSRDIYYIFFFFWKE